MTSIENQFRQISEITSHLLVSEEDVKNKVILPMLRIFGYTDNDFNFERRTGRGYVDIVVDRFPVGIVVEAKSPRTRLDEYVEQIEYYIFKKFSQDRAAIIAILTNGDEFRIYGITEPIRAGSLGMHEIISSFRRNEFTNASLIEDMTIILARGNNESGIAFNSINEFKSRLLDRRTQLSELDSQIGELTKQRDEITAKIRDLQKNRDLVIGKKTPIASSVISIARQSNIRNFPATPHILRLLNERGAKSRSSGVQRRWLDEQLIGKFEGVYNNQSVSFSLIDLKEVGKIDYEKSSRGIGLVWLKQE